MYLYPIENGDFPLPVMLVFWGVKIRSWMTSNHFSKERFGIIQLKQPFIHIMGT